MPTIDYLRVTITVGIDTDTEYGNNRIGGIIVLIKRPKDFATNTTSHNIAQIADQFKIKITASYTDAMTSYDILRSYDTSFLREYSRKTFTDIIFTTYKVDGQQFSNLQQGIGGFFGKENFYINACTINDTCHFTYITRATSFDDSIFLKDDCTELMYSVCEDDMYQSNV